MCVGTRRKKQQPGEGFINYTLKDKLEFSRHKRRERHSREKGKECTMASRHLKLGMLGNK